MAYSERECEREREREREKASGETVKIQSNLLNMMNAIMIMMILCYFSCELIATASIASILTEAGFDNNDDEMIPLNFVVFFCCCFHFSD